jgi:hypothetical protein
VAEPAASTQVQCSTACTVTVVHELVFPPFQMTADEAKELVVPILLVWIVAWGVRMVKKAMDTADIGPNPE